MVMFQQVCLGESVETYIQTPLTSYTFSQDNTCNMEIEVKRQTHGYQCLSGIWSGFSLQAWSEQHICTSTPCSIQTGNRGPSQTQVWESEKLSNKFAPQPKWGCDCKSSS